MNASKENKNVNEESVFLDNSINNNNTNLDNNVILNSNEDISKIESNKNSLTPKESNKCEIKDCEIVNKQILNDNISLHSNLPVTPNEAINIEINAAKVNPFYYMLRVVLCEGKNLAIRDVSGKK